MFLWTTSFSLFFLIDCPLLFKNVFFFLLRLGWNIGVSFIDLDIGVPPSTISRVFKLFPVTVSWIRRRDYHILTSGLHTYSRDARFSVVRSEEADDWALRIRFLQKRDEGAYECQQQQQQWE
ncbi:hypothetical protein E2C01_026502 [Portunus trituberculatus]|uniref:Ig-like domain-containing protein n=1 Tax=Portunus trituberculatus TaxID=210409 RepID=A0A5B7EJ14_PORTR|nr:hypothetical protein [Portunus trituberculatus]